MTREHFDRTGEMGQAEFKRILAERWRELEQVHSKLSSVVILPEMVEVDGGVAEGEGISAMMPEVF